jgi:hypothetical protein
VAWTRGARERRQLLLDPSYDRFMAVLHMTEAEVARDLHAVLEKFEAVSKSSSSTIAIRSRS